MFDSLPLELIEAILWRLDPVNFCLTRLQDRRAHFISHSVPLLEYQIQAAGWSTYADRLVPTSKGGDDSVESTHHSQRSLVAARARSLSSFFSREAALSGFYTPFLQLPGTCLPFRGQLSHITTSQPPGRLVSPLANSLTDSVALPHGQSSQTFSRCGRFLIYTEAKTATIVSLDDRAARPVLRFTIPGTPALVAMDTSEGCYQLAMLMKMTGGEDDRGPLLVNFDLASYLSSRTPTAGGDLDRSIQKVIFNAGNDSRSCTLATDEDITFGPIQTWAEQIPVAELVAPYTGTFRESDQISHSTGIPAYSVRANTRAVVESLAICPRTGAVAFGTASMVSVNWHDTATGTHQNVSSCFLQPVGHVGFLPQSRTDLIVVASPYAACPFELARPIDFTDHLDRYLALARLKSSFVSASNPESSVPAVADRATIYPLTDGKSAVFADPFNTTGSGLYVRSYIDRTEQGPVTRLLSPAGVSGATRSVFVLPGSQGRRYMERVVAVQGHSIVLYSIGSEALDASNRGDVADTFDLRPRNVMGAVVATRQSPVDVCVGITSRDEPIVWAVADGKLESWAFDESLNGKLGLDDAPEQTGSGGFQFLSSSLDALDLAIKTPQLDQLGR